MIRTEAREVGPRSAEATRRRILDAATQEFATKGFGGARMKDIARAADVHPALLHHYFDDKETLHARVIERGLSVLSARGFRVLEEAPSPERAVELWISSVTDFFYDNRALISILHHECSAGGPRIRALVRRTLGPVAEAVVSFLHEGQTAGVFRKDLDPRELVISAIGMVAHYFHEWRTIQALWPEVSLSDEAVARRKREVTKLLLHGVLAAR